MVLETPQPGTSSAPFSRVLHRATVLLGAIALAVTALIGSATTSAAATSVEDTFTTQINQARAARGIPRLTTSSHLEAVARQWAAVMAGQAKLYHNPRLTTEVRNWRYVGENVGYGPDALTVHVAFMNSPGHRANILDRDYTEMGIGAVVHDGRVWVAEVFRRPTRSTPRAVSTSGFPGRLSYGSTGSAVRKVQRRLGLRTTGFYSAHTRAAVSHFQETLGWRGRGNVGRHTWERLF